MTMHDKEIYLDGQEALDLWLEGKDAWNEWVKKHPVADVDFSGVDFSKHRNHPTIKEDNWPFAYFVFPVGKVYFINASFGNGDVSFYYTSFGEGDVCFIDASFGDGNVSFLGASFNDGHFIFHRASFGDGEVNFESINFKDHTNFLSLQNVGAVEKFSFAHSIFQSSLRISSDEPFGCVVDLTNTKMSNHVSLEGVRCNLKKTESLWGSEWLGKSGARDIGDVQRFRRLKEIAGNNKDHQQALNFNVMEMQAKRWHQTTIAGLVFEFIFQKASDYGRSEFLPFKWMIAVWSLWSWFYFMLSEAMEDSLFDKILTAVTFSVGQMLPFVPISRDARSDGAELLFPGDQLPNAVIWLASFQSVISIILIFLIGLSLRNRFKV